MKLALIRRQFSATGGAELYLQRLMDGLLQRGHELHLFCEGWANPPQGIKLHEVGRHGGRSSSPVRFAEMVAEKIPPFQFDCVFSLERTLKQDVYRAGDGVHAAWLEQRKKYSSPFKRLLIGLGKFHSNIQALERQTFSVARTGRIIVNSEMVKREIQQRFNYPAERLHLVRNGINVQKFSSLNKSECRQKLNIPENVYLLLFVGSGWERKGLASITNGILPALNKNAAEGNYKLLVVGKGKERGLQTANVIFAGSTPDVQAAYGAADLFLFLPIYEPSANVCFEAMAAGLPVITTKQNGASEIIREGENGTVLPEPDLISETVAMIHYWKKQGGVTLRPDLKFLSIERNIDETVQVLNMAAEERHAMAASGK